MANREHAKGAREWPTGGAGRPWTAGLGLGPSSEALLHGFRLGLFYPSEGVSVIF